MPSQASQGHLELWSSSLVATYCTRYLTGVITVLVLRIEIVAINTVNFLFPDVYTYVHAHNSELYFIMCTMCTWNMV